MSHSLQKQSGAVRYTVWDPEQKISLAVVLCNRRASYHVAHNNVSKKRLTPFQTALFTAVDVARRVLDQSAGDKLRSMPLLSGGWPKRLMMTHNKRTTSHIKASDHYAARMNESRWQTNTAVPFLLVLNFGEQFVCNKRDTTMDWLGVNLKGLTDWSDLATWLECVSNPLDFLCVRVWSDRNYFYLDFFLWGPEVWRWRFDETLVLLNSFKLFSRLLLRIKQVLSQHLLCYYHAAFHFLILL